MKQTNEAVYIGLYDITEHGLLPRFPDLSDLVVSESDNYFEVLAKLAAHLAEIEASGKTVPAPTHIRELMKNPANRRIHHQFNLGDLERHLQRLNRLAQLKERSSASAPRPEKKQRRIRYRSGRRIAIIRPEQKIRGMRRRVRRLHRWAASFEGFFPEPSYNGLGHKNWYTKLPIYEGLVSGPQARRCFKRECMLALIEIVQRLRRQKPQSEQPIRIVAVLSPDDLFSARVSVFWGNWSFFDYFKRTGPYMQWTPLDAPERSLIREWRLNTDEAEFGFQTRYWDEEWDRPYYGESWALGDVEGLEERDSRSEMTQ